MNPDILAEISKVARPSTSGTWLKQFGELCPDGTISLSADALGELGVQASGIADYCISSPPGEGLLSWTIPGNPGVVSHTSILEVKLAPEWVMSATQLCEELVQSSQGANGAQCVSMFDFVRNVDWGGGAVHTLSSGVELPLTITEMGEAFVSIDHGPYFNDPVAKMLGDYLQIPLVDFIQAVEKSLMLFQTASSKDIYQILRNTPMSPQAAEIALHANQVGFGSLAIVIIGIAITAGVIVFAPAVGDGLMKLKSKVIKK